MKLLDHVFIVRTLSGALLAAAVVWATLLSPLSFFALMLVVATGSMIEFHRLSSAAGLRPQFWYPLAVTVTTLGLNMAVAAGALTPADWLLILLPTVAAIPVIELYRHSKRPASDLGAVFMSLIYIVLPISLLLHLPFRPNGCGLGLLDGHPYIYDGRLFLFYIFILWANDVGAYVFGVLLGRRRIFERHSPKKSWEGFVGGLVLAAALAVATGIFVGQNLWLWGAFGITVSVTGFYGDMIESMLKRAVGVKDSGRIMPGHGGFLDRFDAMFLSAPFAFLLFNYVMR